MKKIFGMILGLGLLCSSAVAAEEAQDGLKVEESKKPSIGWFVGAGMGMVNTNGDAKLPMFGASLNGGIILPHNENVNHLISADLVYQTFANAFDRYYENQFETPIPKDAYKSNGFGIEATINYNLSYDIYKSDTYTFAVLGGLGMGGSFQESVLETNEGSNQWRREYNSRGSFIINANLGVRNILFKNHAIDLTLKSRVLEVYSKDILDKNTDTILKQETRADTNAGFTLMLSYTFLKF